MYIRELPDGLEASREPMKDQEYANPFTWRFSDQHDFSHATFSRVIVQRRRAADQEDVSDQPAQVVGCIVEVRVRGRAVDLSFHDTVVELDAYALRWFATWREPVPVPPPRRGLLYHLVSGFNRWLVEGS